MNNSKLVIVLITLIMFIGFGFLVIKSSPPAKAESEISVSPALNVTVIQPALIDIPLTLNANGSIAPWQEAIIGAEVSDLHLKEVHVEVGEIVRKGQVLALFDNESVLADIAQSKAVLAEAEANVAEAQLNASRAKQVIDSGALSAQQINQYLTGEKTARAKLESAKAQLNNQLLRQKHTRVIASDSGIISSRTATLGAVAIPGQELFRLIRQNRLEWRAEVTAQEIAQLRVGLGVTVKVPNVADADGKVRFLAPTIDAQSRNGLVYVDLPNASAKGLRAGMFAQGEFNLGNSSGLTIPQDSVSLREGFSYVFRLTEQNKDQAKITQVKVQLGRRTGDRFEILSGIQSGDRLVASGVAFLADGDTVRVLQK